VLITVATVVAPAAEAGNVSKVGQVASVASKVEETASDAQKMAGAVEGATRSKALARAPVPEGAGEYAEVGGHHVHAKAGFRGHPTYDPARGFSISQEFMESRGWSHQDMTSAQRRLFDELASSRRPNTLKEHTRIAVEALRAGGATEAEARGVVSHSLRNLRSQGANAPTRIPWN
jgi:hypothetical protein